LIDSRCVARVSEKGHMPFSCFVQSRGSSDLDVVGLSFKACAGQPAMVKLDSRVTFPSGATPRYRWSADAGHFSGSGPSTEWDLTGAKPGYYKAYLEADNGVSEECAVFSSAVVRINCVPPTCPNITISCPDRVEINQPLTFCVNTSGGTPGVRPVYDWSVSAGNRLFGRMPFLGMQLCEVSVDQRANEKGRWAATRSERAVTYKMTGSVESDSTADVVAPAGEARRDRNVERFPGQQRTPTWPARPQASPELQHSNRESEVHFRLPLSSGLEGLSQSPV